MDPSQYAGIRMDPNAAMGGNAGILTATMRRKGDYHKRADGKQAVVRLSPALFALIEGLKECMSLASGGITVTKMDVVSFFLEAAYSEIDRLFAPRRAMPGWMERETALRGAWEAELENRRKAGVVGPLHPPARPLRFAPASVSPSMGRDGVADDTLPVAYTTVFAAERAAGALGAAHGGEIASAPVGPTSGLGSRGRHKWGRKNWYAGMSGRGSGAGMQHAVAVPVAEYDPSGAGAAAMLAPPTVGSEMVVHPGITLEPTGSFSASAATAGGHGAQVGAANAAAGMGAVDTRADAVGYGAVAAGQGRQGRRQLAWTQPNAARNRHAWLREAMRSAEVAAAQEQPMVWDKVAMSGAGGAGEAGDSSGGAPGEGEGTSAGEGAAGHGEEAGGDGGGAMEQANAVGEGVEGGVTGEGMVGAKRKVEEVEVGEEEEQAHKRQAQQEEGADGGHMQHDEAETVASGLAGEGGGGGGERGEAEDGGNEGMGGDASEDNRGGHGETDPEMEHGAAVAVVVHAAEAAEGAEGAEPAEAPEGVAGEAGDAAAEVVGEEQAGGEEAAPGEAGAAAGEGEGDE
ncbi:unnamed protein product [Closterium sp. NIES-65]|nr:unnamed protein product [Closterium sp. NIES-65]CAI5948131.1 unnamed protein product [Closterium sp. NIES-65]